MDTYTQYIKDNFFVDGFWTENEDGYFLLEENDKGGEAQLRFKVQSPENLGILNIDKKNSLFDFFVDSKKLGLNARVDHIVLEKMENEEGAGGRFVLRFGGDCELPFIHTPIQMVKNKNSILIGKYDCKTQT